MNNTDYYKNYENHIKVQVNGFLDQALQFANVGNTSEAKRKLMQLNELLEGSEVKLSGDALAAVNTQIAEIEKVIGVYKNTPKAPNTRTCQPNCANIALSIVGLLSLTFFPVPTLCAAAAAVAYRVYTQNFGRNQNVRNPDRTHRVETPQLDRPIQSTIRVELQKARQYDMEGNIPAACTFHALAAMETIRKNFDYFVQQIENDDSQKLSNEQRKILQEGIKLYNAALKQNPIFVQGANIEDLRQDVLPKGFSFPRGQVTLVVSPDNLKPTLNPIADHLFKNTNGIYAVLMKNSNDESFSCISNGKKAIIFDSHKNEILLCTGKEKFINQLTEKLLPYVDPQNTIDYGLVTIH